MATWIDPADALAAIRREIDRSAMRARNGLKVLAGHARPEVGCTPKELVWQRDKARLYHYRGGRPTVSPPVLLVMSLVTKPYVFDLRPGNSFVEALLDRGFDVYSIDWGIPDAVESANTYESYCDEYLPLAAQAVLRSSGADGLTVYGYCLGGVLAALFVAGHPEVPVRNLVMMATPIDFRPLGVMPKLLREGRLEPEELLDETGNVPPRVILAGMRTYAPTGDLQGYLALIRNLDDTDWVEAREALIGWAQDHIPFPGACFVQTVHWFVRDDQLVRGKVVLGGRDVDLRDVRCPALNVVGAADHLIPPPSADPLHDLLPAVDQLTVKGGHVGLMVGSSAHRRSVPQIAAWLEDHSDGSQRVPV